MNKLWKIIPPPPQSFLEEFPELPPLVAHLLYHRNIKTQKQIDEFLYPDYSEHVHDPFLFRDMKKAVDRLFTAIAQKEKITIHGDYDADGVCASAILFNTLQKLRATELDVFLPHRETDGYGLNKNTVELLHRQNTRVIITCDCGVSNFPEIQRAQELNMDVIVTDHHTIPSILPPAFAIIHPKVERETYPDQGLSGGGVAFKLAQALLFTHEKGNKLPGGETHEAAEKWLLDLVAISSVADMVPLLGESRTLTKYGLLVLNKTRRIGLQKLLLEIRLLQNDGTLKKEITADTIGFQIAPRINAAGRLDHANVAFKLLTTEDPIEATDLAFQLDQNNKERQERTDAFVRQAIEQVETTEQKNNPTLFVFGAEWTTGIVGLIAGRLKEKYQKPVIAMSPNKNDITGSGRSVSGFNMVAALQEIPQFFQKFGGHPLACGFTLLSPECRSEFEQALNQKYYERTKDVDMTVSLNVDAEVSLNEVNWELYDCLDKLKPFGQKNEKPKYLVSKVTVTGMEAVGADKRHLRLLIRQNGGIIRKTIGWNLCDENKGDCVNWSKDLTIGEKIDVVFEIDVNEWNGNRELQLTIVDLRKSETLLHH